MMENLVVFGNLRAYLKVLTNATYTNTKSDDGNQTLKEFAKQVTNGWMAVNSCEVCNKIHPE